MYIDTYTDVSMGQKFSFFFFSSSSSIFLMDRQRMLHNWTTWNDRFSCKHHWRKTAKKVEKTYRYLQIFINTFSSLLVCLLRMRLIWVFPRHVTIDQSNRRILQALLGNCRWAGPENMKWAGNGRGLWLTRKPYISRWNWVRDWELNLSVRPSATKNNIFSQCVCVSECM